MAFLKSQWKRFPTVLILLIFLSGCRQRVTLLKSPPHYKFGEGVPFKLDLKIREISGIYWDPVKNEFIANNDESGKLFYLDKESKQIKSEISFGGKGDYEDVAMVKGIPYVLRSDGLITKVMKDSAGRVYGLEEGKLGLTGTNDFETMYYDDVRNALIIICKNCALDNKTKVSAFAYYLDSTGFDNKPVYTIDAEEVKSLAPKKTSKFQPSAAAIHPLLNKLFIISSASNQLVIADRDGVVESVYVLSRKMFPQPEGITIKKNGEMFISNEGVTSKATLILFKYIP
jgi:uncharacterized protein YjiK